MDHAKLFSMDDTSLAHCRALLDDVSGRALSSSELCRRSIELAAALWEAAERERSPLSMERGQVLTRMMHDRRGQVFTTTLTDRAHRSRNSRVAVSQAAQLLATLGVPRYLGWVERFQLRLVESFGRFWPGLTHAQMLARIQRETSTYIVSADHAGLTRYLADRASEGTQVIVNHLGEEVLGEVEAERRVRGYTELVERPDVQTISVKVSSISSQLDPLAFDRTVAALSERLGTIYERALESERDGAAKYVVLDMEAYRDLELTLVSMRNTLDRPELLGAGGGCALQAYLPDSFEHLKELLVWATERSKRGGRPVRLRIVKGANLAAERLESEQRGFELPTYPSKRAVDANYKRMILLASSPDHANAAEVGIASHNIFDVAFGLLVRASRGLDKQVGFELLAGMADHLRVVLEALGATVRVYTPVVEPHEFASAIAYLVRRLDENTDPHNFLRHSFGMRVDDPAWLGQREAFEAACGAIESTPTTRRRAPTVGVLTMPESLDQRLAQPFRNEPDTDWSCRHDRVRLQRALDALSAPSGDVVASCIDGQTTLGERRPGVDPSRPGHVPYELSYADADAVERAIACGVRAFEKHRESSTEHRARLLLGCADELRRARAELIARMLRDAGKRADEADVEVSEAIDFAEYYARSALRLQLELDGSGAARHPVGLVVVTPPWNFPLAIPLGGVFAALAAGNAVVLKPASETPDVARLGAELCWRAGVPRELLQLLICDDSIASALVVDERVRAVVLTGATSTARLFLEMRPELELLAETGGKNALIVMPMADRELAIQDAVSSAFGHAGQKCSALSQLILHRELYEDPAFLATLRDAAASLPVGSAWDQGSRVTPLIAPPNAVQTRALTELDAGETWLLEPKMDPENPRLVSPGIKLGVRAGSFSHRTEFFCPVLSVLCADSLDEAIDLANGTPYGLTSGIHSLDERDQARWLERIEAGNLYVNRRITGAIVQRQPFGGWKASSFGAAAKAGGPNYLLGLSRFETLQVPDVGCSLPSLVQNRMFRLDRELELAFGPVEAERLSDTLARVIRHYQRDFERHFAEPWDATRVRGQDNYLRYVPLRLAVHLSSSKPLFEGTSAALFCLLASWVSGSELRWFADSKLASEPLLHVLNQLSDVQLVREPALLLQELDAFRPARILCLGNGRGNSVLPRELQEAAKRLSLGVSTRTPVASGRVELLTHLKEQSICISTHRYGHLGLKEVLETEDRAA
jgi:RHH-type transcriptional regulator, proline utilization regulon repressor / proline dehydrogenase / delta 1-pyrroline-5-carboxylate dehydrogenase